MGLVGRGGRIYSKFGIGQSLLTLPFEILATGLSRWAPSVAGNAAKSALWNGIFVVYSVSALVCVLAILASLRLLLLFEFTAREAPAGSLTLQFATIFLLYTQRMQENNCLLLLTLAGLGLQYEWATTCSKRALPPRLWSEPFDAANDHA